MGIVTVGVESIEQSMQRAKAAFRGEPQGEHITFESVALMWEILTLRRMQLIQAMAGKGSMSIRAASRLLGKDIKTIHPDVQALLRNGILSKADDGGIIFPYDAIHVDFMIEAA